MIKTVASVRKDIIDLAHRLDEIYDKEVAALDLLIKSNEMWIEENCRHQEDNLIIDEVSVEDDYGNFRSNLTEYVITCSVCGKVEMINKSEFDTGKETFSRVMNYSNNLKEA